MKLVIFSDAHIHAWAEHSRDDRGAPSRLRHCLSVLEQVRAYCMKHRIHRVLFGGDLFHKRGVLYTQPYNLVVEELAAWNRAGLHLYANVGNHDLADRAGKVHALQALRSAGLLITVGDDGWSNWSFSDPDGHEVHDSDDVRVTAVAYCPGADELRRRTDAALEARAEHPESRFTIGLFHHGFRGAKVGTSLEYVVKEDADPDAYAKEFSCMFCVDEDTEALTPDGWKRHDDLRKGSLIACVTPEQGKFTWLPIQKMNRGPSPGSMLSFGGGRSHIDHVVTDNHMMWIRRVSGSWTSMRADAVFETPIHRPYLVQTTARMFGGTWDWRGSAWGGSELDAAEFVGWYLAEGAISKGRGGKPANVAIAKSISAYPGEYDRICALVTRLGFRPSHHKLMVRVCSASLARWMLVEFGDGCVNKRIPAWVKGWPKKHLDRLVRTMIEGDGHEINAGLATYDTASKRLADDLQEVCIKLGWSSTLSTRKRKNRKRIYTLTIVRRELPEREFTQLRKRVEYTGTVWCPTVETGLWFARRNGRVIVTKNSGHYHAHQEIGTLGNAWYVGSPMEFVRGETSPKGFLVLDTEEGSVERVDLDLPRFVKLTGAQIGDDDFDVEAHVRGNFVDVVFDELPMPWDSVEGVLRKLGAEGIRACPTRPDKLPKSSRLEVDPTMGDRQLLERYMEHVGVDPSERGDLLRAGLLLLEEAAK